MGHRHCSDRRRNENRRKRRKHRRNKSRNHHRCKPKYRSPYSGWWKCESQSSDPLTSLAYEGNFVNFLAAFTTNSYIEINAENDDYKYVDIYTGIPVKPRFPTSTESTVPDDTPIRVELVTKDDLLVAKNDDRIGFQMQACHKRLVIFTEFFEADLATLKRIRKRHVPEIRKFDSNQLPLADDPVEIFNYYTDLLLTVLPQKDEGVKADIYIGYDKSIELRDKLLTSTRCRSTKIAKIFKTLIATEGSTTLCFNKWHHVNTNSTITLDGFTDPYWSQYNGQTFDVVGFTTTTPVYDGNYVDYSCNPDKSTYAFQVNILLDSSDAPENSISVERDSPFTGDARCSVSYGPINPGTTYRELWAAIGEFFYSTFKISLHNTYGQFANKNGYFPTPFESIYKNRSDILEDIQYDKPNVTLSTPASRVNASRASGYYLNLAASLAFENIPDIYNRQRSNIDINNPYGIRPDLDRENVDGYYFQNITRDNYIVNGKVLCYKSAGALPQDPSAAQINIAALYPPANNTIGRTLEGVLADTGVPPPVPLNYFGTGIPPNGGPFWNTYADTDITSPWIKYTREELSIVVGMVNPNFTDGKRIGYLRLPNYFNTDAYQFIFNKSLSLEDPIEDRRGEMECVFRVFSVAMKYLVDSQENGGLEIDDLILDNRNNKGGFVKLLPVLASFIGGNRHFVKAKFLSSLGSGRNGPISLDNLEYPTQVEQYYEYLTYLDTERSEASYGNCVFKNGNLIVLTDVLAGSGGDITPNLYLGEDQNGYLGNNVKSMIMGDLDGRLMGYNSDSLGELRKDTLFRNVSADSLFNFIPPNAPLLDDFGTFEGGLVGMLRSDGTSLFNRNEQMIPTKPVLRSERGKNGKGPMPNDLLTTLYRDFGITENTIPRLPGDTRPIQPVFEPELTNTWEQQKELRRDSWFEACVRKLLTLPKPKTLPSCTCSLSCSVPTSVSCSLCCSCTSMSVKSGNNKYANMASTIATQMQEVNSRVNIAVVPQNKPSVGKGGLIKLRNVKPSDGLAKFDDNFLREADKIIEECKKNGDLTQLKSGQIIWNSDTPLIDVSELKNLY